MKKITLTLLILISASSIAQKKENLSIGTSFAHFDDTNGFEIYMGYCSTINRYLGFELKMDYATTSDFPNNYRFSKHINQNYWFTKSTIFNITPNLHILFINENKHRFSLYTGIGLMFSDSVDNTNQTFETNQFTFQSSTESYSGLSKTIGVRYTYYIKNYSFGLDAKLTSPLKNNKNYFGQDNYRSIGLFITKQF